MSLPSSLFHPLEARFELPPLFNNPFCYEPHPLCLAAAAEVRQVVSEMDVSEGKMFGVLVVRRSDGAIGFLAAYSGLLDGRNDWPYFVPPVFDAQRPDGHFKQTERLIDALNRRINLLETDPRRVSCEAELHRLRQTAQTAVTQYKERMARAKQRRDALRATAAGDEQTMAALIRESQFMKAELHRLKLRYAEAVASAKTQMAAFDAPIRQLKEQRRQMSDELQAWLFDQYRLLNARGEAWPLAGLFVDTASHMPPAGAGDCCAPKLLQCAYSEGLQPLCMGEFWWGPSPAGEVRREGRFYPACQGKCRPILRHMLEGLAVQPNALEQCKAHNLSLPVVYEDEWLVVVDKPAELLSVPGRGNLPSVVSMKRGLLPVHRLDMATSGLLVLARSRRVLSALQQQFAERCVKKEYVALVDGIVSQPHGVIELPLSPDYDDRPRQRVDWATGKQAVTEYDVMGYEQGMTRLLLRPHTGRTHQLRVHCAHPQGLGMPIHGDVLYGQRDRRLCLHARSISFAHPVTGQPLTVTCDVPF